MPDGSPPWIEDFITGRRMADVGPEANRQALERYLVEIKGYRREDIRVDAPLEIVVAGEPYHTRIDLLVAAGPAGTPYMLIKCAAGSLGSWERQIVSAGRIFGPHQVPLAVVSNGVDAVVMDTHTGKRIAQGMAAIPSRQVAWDEAVRATPLVYPEERREREKQIFRSYDSMTVNKAP
jgi:hypothetical protein